MEATSKATGANVQPAALSGNHNGIDLVKFICAYLVVSIHIAPFPYHLFGIGTALNFYFQQTLCRLAVPFYFIASGYFLFRKMDVHNPDSERIKDYCFKILRFIGIWSILLVVGHTGHMWYLGATVGAVILLTLCLKRGMQLRSIFLLALLLYCIGLLGDSYYQFLIPLKNITVFRYIANLYEYFFESTRNGVFMGFIFMVMGMLFANSKIPLRLPFAVVGLISSSILLIAETYLLTKFSSPKDYNMLISLLPASFFLFHLAKNIQLKNRGIYKKLRVIGVLVFYLHQLIYHCVGLGMDILNRRMHQDFSAYAFIATVLLSTLCGILIEWLSCRKRFGWLKLLYC